MPLPHNHSALPAHAYLPLQAIPGADKFSWSAEMRHLCSYKFLNIVWWPVFKIHQRWFTQSPFLLSCKKLPGFTHLWQTIQKGSFAYNTLFLGMSPLYRPSTDLADITTLALFFGDEFIDGLSETAGKPFIRQLVQEDPDKFYLRVKINSDTVTLQYCFDLTKVLPPFLLKQVNPQYGISYHEFYSLLQSFLQLINESLGRLPFLKAEKTAHKIADACNACFESFLHDVNSCPVPGNIRDIAAVIHFHESKTAYMQKKLLDLRCVLVNKEEVMNNSQAAGWMDIMRVIQIYDDIQDVIIDDGLQDNIVSSAAFYHFPAEWEWFCTHKSLLEKEKEKLLLLSLYMPCSMEYCLRLASDKIAAMNWEQQKIMHYLIFKNKYVLYKGKADGCFAHKTNFLLQFYRQVKDRMPHLSDQLIKSYAIDTCIHLKDMRNQLLRKVRFSTEYQLRYNLLSMPAEKKAIIFDAVTGN